MNSRVVDRRRSLYLAKNDKIMIMVQYKGVVSQPSKSVDGGGLLWNSRVTLELLNTYVATYLEVQALKTLHGELCKKLELGMSLKKVYRPKIMVERIISGDCQLLNTTPNTTVQIYVYLETSLSITTRTFIRVYVCLGILNLGFKAGLRDFLGVDCTFLKGPYHRQVLTVLGLDSNNDIYFVSYIVVETEPTKDLDLGAHSNFTFISDRQKVCMT
uniref:Uncharacterized protein n=1 Tax=Lactuca sativa TaxID=4236 RepID=A0A9R1WJR6_LACSA|nr:hypothetical protein LSAT_V11C200056420 [Lactuca sativa]